MPCSCFAIVSPMPLNWSTKSAEFGTWRRAQLSIKPSSSPRSKNNPATPAFQPLTEALSHCFSSSFTEKINMASDISFSPSPAASFGEAIKDSKWICVGGSSNSYFSRCSGLKREIISASLLNGSLPKRFRIVRASASTPLWGRAMPESSARPCAVSIPASAVVSPASARCSKISNSRWRFAFSVSCCVKAFCRSSSALPAAFASSPADPAAETPPAN